MTFVYLVTTFRMVEEPSRKAIEVESRVTSYPEIPMFHKGKYQIMRPKDDHMLQKVNWARQRKIYLRYFCDILLDIPWLQNPGHREDRYFVIVSCSYLSLFFPVLAEAQDTTTCQYTFVVRLAAKVGQIYDFHEHLHR